MTTSTEADFNQTKAKSWLNCENNNLTLPLAKDNEWVIYNMQMAGIFRVSYDTRNWMGIISMLNDPNKYKTIHKLNRVQLIDDSFSFSQNGDLDYEITFQLLKYLKHENEYTPWLAASDGFTSIYELMQRTQDQVVFQNYMQRMLLPVYSKFRNMTTKLNDFEEIRFKNLVIAEACRYRINDCIEQAVNLFSKWMNTTDPDKNNILPIELKNVIYCQAIKNGGIAEWDFLWERYQRSNVASEKVKFLSALGCSSDTWLLNRFLNWTLDSSIIRKQDAITVFYYVVNSDVGFLAAKNFLYSRFVDISKYFNNRGSVMSRYIKLVGSRMKTNEELEEIKLFMIKTYYFIQDGLNISETAEALDMNIAWMSKFYPKIVNYLV